MGIRDSLVDARRGGLQPFDEVGGEAFGGSIPWDAVEERAAEEVFEDGGIGEGREMLLMIVGGRRFCVVQDCSEERGAALRDGFQSEACVI